jgi:hypothetical protein
MTTESTSADDATRRDGSALSEGLGAGERKGKTMAIHKLEGGECVIASGGLWLPGTYEDERAARYAFRLPNAALQRLQDNANARAGGMGGVITWGDIAKEAENERAAKSRPNVKLTERARQGESG